MYEFFGHKARMRFLSWDKWCSYIHNDTFIDQTYTHVINNGYYHINQLEQQLKLSFEIFFL